MTTSDKGNKLLDHVKLRALLKAHGEYPAEYRTIIWRFLLRLPENHEQFEELQARGIHRTLKGFHSRYPVQDRRIFRRLTQVLSVLFYWCPLLSEVDFLPGIVYPFLSLFPSDNTLCFEVVAILLLNWGRTWFEFFPNPPLATLKEVDDLLGYHDSVLLSHLMAHGIQSITYAWPLIKTVFTQVLSRPDWLLLCDHLISNRPTFINFLVLAYLIHFRKSIMSMESSRDIENFVCRSHGMGSMGRFIQKAYRLRKHTPDERTPSESQWISLESGYYPDFQHYPKFVVDFQLKERERIEQDEEELHSKRISLEDLQRKTLELERERDAWERQQLSMRNAEIERRSIWAEQEEFRLRERKRLDCQTIARRKQQIDVMASTVQAQIRADQDCRMAELKRSEDEEVRHRGRSEYDLKHRLEEEAVLNLEFQMSQTLLERKSEQQRREESDKRRLIIEQNKKAKDLKMAKLMEQWRIEDEERRVRQHIIQDTREKLIAVNREMHEQQIIDNQLLLEQLDEEIGIAHVDRERRLRHLAQDELERVTDLEHETQRRTKLLNLEERRSKMELIEHERRWRERIESEREQLLQAEKSRAVLEDEKRAHRLEQVEREQRHQDFVEEMHRRHIDQQSKLVAEEKEIQSVLLNADEETRKARHLEFKMRWRDEQLQEQLTLQKALKEAEAQVIADERKRYEQLQDEMRAKFKLEELELERQHQQALNDLVLRHQTTIASNCPEWRQSAHQHPHDNEIESEYRLGTKPDQKLKAPIEKSGQSDNARPVEKESVQSNDGGSMGIGGLRAEFRDLLGKQREIGDGREASALPSTLFPEDGAPDPNGDSSALDQRAHRILYDHERGQPDGQLGSIPAPISAQLS